MGWGLPKYVNRERILLPWRGQGFYRDHVEALTRAFVEIPLLFTGRRLSYIAHGSTAAPEGNLRHVYFTTRSNAVTVADTEMDATGIKKYSQGIREIASK